MEPDGRTALELFDALPAGEHHPGESVTNRGRVALAGYRDVLKALVAAPCQHACKRLPKLPECQRCLTLARGRERMLEELR